MAEGCDSKCGICLSFIFTEPKLLDCYHTFCLPCLQKLDINDNKISCPLCTTSMSLPVEGVSGLKPYPYKLEYVKVSNEVMDACDLCDDKNFAVSICLDCKTNLCSKCRDYHGKLKTSKNHVIQPLKIIESENLDQTEHAEATVKKKCKDHCKELTLFCRPCNTLLCIDCSEEFHPCHKVENLSVLLQTKKEMLLVRIASFKSRISFLQNTAEMVELKENNYDKYCLVLKQDVKVHATNLKDMFCRTVDKLANRNLDIINDIKKKDMIELDKYKKQIYSEKMSLSGLIMTTENFIYQSSDKNFLEEFPVIGKRLDSFLCKSVNIFPSMHDLGHEWDAVSEAVIEKIFGKVTASEKEKELKPMYPLLPVPELCLVPSHKAEKVAEFVVNNVLDIVPADNNNAWILTPYVSCMYSSKGKKGNSYEVHPEIKRFVRMSASRILLCHGNNVVMKKEAKYYICYKVQLKNVLHCCVVRNNKLIVYNPIDKIFYGIFEPGLECRQERFEIKDMENQLPKDNSFSGEHIIMKQSKNFNFVISFCKDIVVFTDNSFIVVGFFQKLYAQFKAIATDNYGNVLVADYIGDIIYLLSENGVIQQTLLNNSYGVHAPTNMIVDECGYLWIVEASKCIKVFSYQ
ncbi:Hypothetical predicted protein [Mytilus galloprovincialis]|uniref:TRIM56 n=1 Tax=Mytilus galloprovincialis TaxID=29158 RepID=A0A8B6DE32_MYTGA|nr:Hypothetical predicted protein [Mytilus galloprovincialis]